MSPLTNLSSSRIDWIFCFRIPHNTLCLPLKFCISYCLTLQMLLGKWSTPRSINFENNGLCKIWGSNRGYCGGFRNKECSCVALLVKVWQRPQWLMTDKMIRIRQCFLIAVVKPSNYCYSRLTGESTCYWCAKYGRTRGKHCIRAWTEMVQNEILFVSYKPWK